MKIYARSLIFLSFFLFLGTNIFAAGLPGWLSQSAALRAPTYDKDVPAVVLRDEKIVTLNKNGGLVTEERFGVRILNREGRGFAVARAFYLVSAGKIENFKAWVINPKGNLKSYGKKETLDVISDVDDVYNEGRIKVIDASGDVDTGYVFGYSYTKKENALFYQDLWQFQGRLPTLVSRYSVNLPSGWAASAKTFNHPEISPTIDGSSYAWELRALQPIPPEPMSPSVKNLAPSIAINFKPDRASLGQNRVFDNWIDVSRWATNLYDPQVVVNDEIAIKARELTANATSELEKIEAIGTFVQNLQYISIDIGVAYGNGYRPRPSDAVLKRGYGDCKDKATLMRALLRAVKIEAYPVAIYSGDPSFVRKGWASPRQFNHCIIAVIVGKETDAATIIEDENLGRLMIFDATDDMTPVGDLPDYLQGSYALIMAGDKGGLVEMPVTPPENNSLERSLAIKLDKAGSISGSIHETTLGQASRYERSIFRGLSSGEYKKTIERWITTGATAARLMSYVPKDNHLGASFELSVEFSAAAYGQLMQGRLLIFKPAIVNRSRSIYLTEKERAHPIAMESNSFSEKAVFELPFGFTVDEMPDSQSLKTSFGEYSSSFELKGRNLVFRRRLVTKRALVPAEKYSEVRDFYRRILDAEQSPVVLLKNQ